MILESVSGCFSNLNGQNQIQANLILQKYFDESLLKEMYVTTIKIYAQKVQNYEKKEKLRRQRWYYRFPKAVEKLVKRLINKS